MFLFVKHKHLFQFELIVTADDLIALIVTVE